MRHRQRTRVFHMQIHVLDLLDVVLGVGDFSCSTFTTSGAETGFAAEAMKDNSGPDNIGSIIVPWKSRVRVASQVASTHYYARKSPCHSVKTSA